MKIFTAMNCVVLLASAFAASAQAAPGACKKGPQYSTDEAKNKKGPNKCDDDCDCDGARTCSATGWCEGAARPAEAKAAPNYGTGNTVACYIKDRSKPAMTQGWSMLWKDSVARSKGCAEVLQGCRDMTKKWAGTDVCCTLQGGDVKVTGKKAGDACSM
jgi:hypothetical protein